jgi:LPS export ABC transporter protein LptC
LIPRRLLGGLLVGLVLGSTGCRKIPPDAGVPSDSAQKPTQVLKDFEMNDIKDGVKTMTVKSIEGRMYESRNVADVDQPLIFFYQQGKESSHLQAPVGRVWMDSHAVEVWGGVTVISVDSSTLKTERLRYNPKTQKITSTDTVHMEKPDSITDGIGLETDPDLKRVKIGRQKVHFKKGMAQ